MIFKATLNVANLRIDFMIGNTSVFIEVGLAGNV